MTARQQVELVLEWGEGAAPRRARGQALEVLGQLGLAGKVALRPAELSGGEKQLVAVARALVKAPALLFADEPTASLDWGHGQRVVELLRSAAHERGTTVLVVSHDPRLLSGADRTYYLEDGRLREGSAGDLHRQTEGGVPGRQPDPGVLT